MEINFLEKVKDAQLSRKFSGARTRLKEENAIKTLDRDKLNRNHFLILKWWKFIIFLKKNPLIKFEWWMFDQSNKRSLSLFCHFFLLEPHSKIYCLWAVYQYVRCVIFLTLFLVFNCLEHSNKFVAILHEAL